MALFGRGTPSRFDDPRKGARDASRQFMAVAEEFRKAGRFREAIETLERGVRENPGYVAAHVALGRAFQLAELFPKAVLAYQDALKFDRENLVAVRQLAECYMRMGDKVEAIKKLKLFRGLSPGDKDVVDQIQKIEVELEAERRAAAELRKEPSGTFGRPRRGVTGTIPPLPPRGSASRLSTETLPGFIPPAAATAPITSPVSPPPVAAAPPESVLAAPEAKERPAEHVPAFESFFDEALVPDSVAPATGPVASLRPPVDAPPPQVAEPPPPPAAEVQAFESFFEEPLTSESTATPLHEEPAAPARSSASTGPVDMIWQDESLISRRPPVLSADALAEEESIPAESEAAVPAPAAPESAETPEPPERETLPGTFVEEVAAPDADTEVFSGEVVALGAEPATEPPVVEPAAPAPVAAPPPPAVSPTLAELYREQGHLADAAQAYAALAETTPDAGAAASYREKSRALSEERSTAAGRLRAFARRLPAAPRTRIEEMAGVLEGLRTRTPGIKAAVLTDLEGLPVVAAAESGGDPASEALVAELTAFWKSVQRTEDEVGAGALEGVSLKGEAGGVVVATVSPEYSLILHVERDVPLGRIRYEAARAAGMLRPALG